jgi:serine/threonine protein kinase/predicted ATPase
VNEVIGGRYRIMRKLASGGMAEVFLARHSGLEGFERLCVVKRILPHHAENQDFIRMFLDEARIAGDLRHPNVVSVSDMGQDAGVYFVAMEYLHGKDLGQVFSRCREVGERLPIDVSLQMIQDAAAGLHYAHTKKNLQGEPLHIVHRDVSPQNIFTTFDGHSRVLDFGIARANNRSTRTDAGVVKGKFSYLSPEQLEGGELDGRSDLFALGIVTWELTTLTRLFQRPSDAEVLRAVMECRIPRPSTVVPDYPVELEDILLKAMSKSPAARFDSCETFRAALEEFLGKRHLAHSAARVGTSMRALFPGEAEALPQADEKKEVSTIGGSTENETRADGAQKPRKDPLQRPPTQETRPSKKVLKEAEGFLQMVQDFLGAAAHQRKTNVVPPLGPFIGRQADLAALEALFSQGTRLVTLVGFGGMGKTRLSLEYALLAHAAWARTGGTWFCDLSDCKSADDICKAVARALQVETLSQNSDDDTVTHAARTLKNLGPALVVLDNFEQIVDHARTTVGRWLELSPETRFLVTTREALRLPGEKVHPLTPLGFDEGGRGAAVELFLERMKASGAKPAEGQELRDVAEVVRRLDGHPLAIELAAARTPQLRPRELVDKLGQRFELLGGKETPGRHATLWNAIDWSYQLLDAQEKSAFAILSVFDGGFTLEAASGVLSAVLGTDEVLPLVDALHRKSLLRPFVAQEMPDVLRLTMLESIHEFAAEALETQDLGPRARDAHASWFLDQGDLWAEDVHAHEAVERMGTLRIERENLLKVFGRALSATPRTATSAEHVLRALNVLDPLLARQGPFSSHLALLDAALEVARTTPVDRAYIARALAQKGNALKNRGRLHEAVAALSEALEEVKKAADEPLMGRICCELGVARFVLGDLGQAEEDLNQCLSIARTATDPVYEARALSFLAILKVAMGELGEALALCDEALPLTRAQGDRVSEARVLGTIGALYLEEESPQLAQAYYAEAVERCRQVGELRLRGYFLGKLSSVTQALSRFELSKSQLDEAISTLSEVGDLRHEGLFLLYRATSNARLRRFEEAQVDLSAAEARLRSVKDPLLLTTLALKRMIVSVHGRSVGRAEVKALLDDVRSPRGNRPARSQQSEEVRLAAKELEKIDRQLAGAA